MTVKTPTQGNGIAPSVGRYKVGAKGGRVALAFQEVWDNLSRTEFRDVVVLAEKIASKHQIKPISLMTHMAMIAKEGFLETQVRQIPTEVERAGRTFTASRRHTHYRIKS
jgi:hypothetical protein